MMDPYANIAEARGLASDILARIDGTSDVDVDDVSRLCELTIALDDWRRRGGFASRTSQRVRWHAREGELLDIGWAPSHGYWQATVRFDGEARLDSVPLVDVSVESSGGEDADKIRTRLEYLRGELRAERISLGELVELQGLAAYIEPGDVELLEAAGVPEHEEGS